MENKRISKGFILLGAAFAIVGAAAVAVSFGLFGPLGL